MKIVNPLYDKAFKYLMEKDRLAKKVISVILDEEIEDLQLSQQETIVPDEKRQLSLFRLDFKAKVKKADGTKQTVLIELQKSKYITDIQRFRTYLGSNYIKSELEKDANGVEQKVSYPIISIYILGYKLEDIPYMAVTVNHKIINSVTKETLQLDSDFINQLNHRSHILQVRRLPENRISKLEQFLTLFNQAWITDQRYILDLHDVPEEFEEIARYLQTPVMEDSFRRQLEAEEEIDMIFDQQENKYLKQIEEAKKVEEEAKQRENEAKQGENDAKEREIEAKQAELEQHKQTEKAIASVYESARQMLKFGMPLETIAAATRLTIDEIKKL
jgi:hypothetical protein